MSEAETDKRSRRERRAEANGTQQDEIKDRNQRLRAEAIARRKSERKKDLSAARAEGLAPAERVDDALVRGADGATRLMRDNFKWLQWVFVLGLAGSMAYLVFDYRRGVDREARGEKVAAALDAVSGRLTSATPVTPSDRNLVDTRPEFESQEKKLEAALGRFTDLTKSKDPELRLLGLLGRAGVFYDQQKFADARTAYEDVFKNPLSAQFLELRVRAAEGIVLCHEAEGRFDDAAKAAGVLRELGGQAADLGALHASRIAYQKGDLPGGERVADQAYSRRSPQKRAADAPPTYIEAAARELQKSVDPAGAAAAASADAAKSGGITPEQLEELKRQFEAMQKSAPAQEQAPPSTHLPWVSPGSETDDPIDAAPAAPAPAAPVPAAPTPAAPAAAPQEGRSPSPQPARACARFCGARSPSACCAPRYAVRGSRVRARLVAVGLGALAAGRGAPACRSGPTPISPSGSTVPAGCSA